MATEANLTQDQKYNELISYLVSESNSGSEFFILRPGKGINSINLKSKLVHDNSKAIIDYLLGAEQEGAKIFIRKPNQGLRRVLLSKWFRGRIANTNFAS